MKDGWLGGDNALSIPLSSTKTLWIFSDSFVGSSHIPERKSSKLVANTAAISSCENSETSVQYYWRKTQDDSPEPIFETFNNEYKYWPTEAFEYNNTLYVALHKVKPGPDTNADDLFNFSLVGTTLAEIKDFKDTVPDRWKIVYTEWPDVFDPEEWNAAMTVDGDYLYVFIGRKAQQYNLVRLPLTHLRQPDSAIEYFSTSGTWKPGYEKSDAMVVLEGTAGGSVKFHKSINQWVMIYGPEFLSGNILIRTSDKISGPWSKPENLYEIPEQVKGNRAFHPTYFTYGAREHFAFCDENNGILCVTYDCNSSDFNLLVNTHGIYTPRILNLKITKD